MTTQAAEQNVEAVRRGIEAMTAGNLDELRGFALEAMHPDCEWIPLVTAVEGSYRGHEGILRFFEDFVGSFSVAYDVKELRALGDHAVLMLGVMKLSGRSSEVDVNQEIGVLWEFDAGLLRRGRVYGSQVDALAAVEALDA